MSRLSFHDLLLTINPSLDPYCSDKKNYVLVKKLDGDYKKLQTLSLKEYNNITLDITTRQNVNMFEEKLAQFTHALQKRCIPVDRIEVNGQSGIILTSDLYYKILQEQIRQNAVAHANNIYSDYCTKDIRAAVIEIMKNATKDDVLYPYVPLSLNFEPYSTTDLGDRTSNVKSLSYIGIDNEFKEFEYSGVVDLNEFISLLQADGYILEFEDHRYSNSKRGPIESYDKYLEYVKQEPTGILGFSMNIDLRDNNNNMRR